MQQNTAVALMYVGVFLPLIGVWLIKKGLNPPRRGKAPHCARCNYNLSGLTSDRCPECGTPLQEGSNTLTGEAWHSKPYLVVGSVCLLGAAISLLFLPFVISLLIVGVVLAQLLFNQFMRRFDYNETPLITEPFTQDFNSIEEFHRFLQKHGSPTPGFEIPAQHLPLHASFIELFCTYDCVTVEEWPCYERSLLNSPYEDNNAFVQFGTDVAGSPILARRCSEDPVVYISDVEECLPDQVRRCATSLQAYFLAMNEQLGTVETNR